MKKIWIGGNDACDIHNEKVMIQNYIKSHNFELTTEVEKAEIIIIIDTCLGTYEQLISSFECIAEILKIKREDAKVIVSGCLVKGVKFTLTEEQKEILSNVKMVNSEEIVPYIAKLLTGKLTPDDFDIPYSVEDLSIQINPVSGCLNHCSFCKRNYMNFELKSYPFEKVESLAFDIEKLDYPFSHISLYSSNLSLYGLDLYEKSRAHEVIRTFTKPDKIKFAYVGALINWYSELVDEIITNFKIKEIFISLESGSSRVYKLMNRPISLENLIKIIRFIRKERPDIIVQTEFIAGFPTETIDDIKRTIELAYELDVYPAFVWPYFDSPQIPSSELPQHSPFYCYKTAKYMREKLMPLRAKRQNKIWNGEMFVVKKYEKEECYATLLINGRIRNVGFDQLDRDYQEGEIISANSVKAKQLVKRK